MIKVKFQNLVKEFSISPPIGSIIFNSEGRTPKFIVNSRECEFKLSKQNGDEIKMVEKYSGDSEILTVKPSDYAKVITDETWKLNVIHKNNLLCTDYYQITPPPLSFYRFSCVF